MSGISKSQVSKLCEEIDERVHSFLDRKLEGEWPYLWLDAAYLKVRENGRIVSVAAIIASAVNAEGRREIIGLGLRPSEAAVFWLGFAGKPRPKGVKLIISDAHEGLKAAIAQVFKASWQRCRVHFMRNALAHASKTHHSMVSGAIRSVFAQDDQAAASRAWRHVADQLRARFPKLSVLMDAAEADVLAFMAFPRAHWPKLHSTNPLERLNKEVKRRADVVGIFPNDASIRRLVGAILLEQNDMAITTSLHELGDDGRPRRRSHFATKNRSLKRRDDRPPISTTLTDAIKLPLRTELPRQVGVCEVRASRLRPERRSPARQLGSARPTAVIANLAESVKVPTKIGLDRG
jgi:transposase-like protein